MTLGKKGGEQMPPVLPPGYAPGTMLKISCYLMCNMENKGMGLETTLGSFPAIEVYEIVRVCNM